MIVPSPPSPRRPPQPAVAGYEHPGAEGDHGRDRRRRRRCRPEGRSRCGRGGDTRPRRQPACRCACPGAGAVAAAGVARTDFAAAATRGRVRGDDASTERRCAWRASSSSGRPAASSDHAGARSEASVSASAPCDGLSSWQRPPPAFASAAASLRSLSAKLRIEPRDARLPCAAGPRSAGCSPARPAGGRRSPSSGLVDRAWRRARSRPGRAGPACTAAAASPRGAVAR